jgi:glycosyltransferase involved in cell wall biosynthesis
VGAEVTIVIPNWNTGPLMRVCLSSLLRYTRHPSRILVVDNASDDASRETLEDAAGQGLIQLVTREDPAHDGAPEHAASLDLGVELSETPYVFTLDSDAWARREGWLSRWVAGLAGGASHVGARKFPGGRIKRLFQWLRGEGRRPEANYVRPCHALYRRELLQAYGLSFAPYLGADDRWRTTGERIHELLLGRGHVPTFLTHAEVEAQIGHIRHATMVLNAPTFPGLRRKTRLKGELQISGLLRSREVAELLAGSPIR